MNGIDLLFVVYPAMLSTLPLAHFWTIIYFIILVNIGLSSNYIYFIIIIEFISDLSSKFKGWFISKGAVTKILITLILIIDIAIFASDVGIYWVSVLDHYACTINIMLFYTIQSLAFVYFMPLDKLKRSVVNFGESFPEIYTIPLKYISPIFGTIMTLICIYNEITNPNAQGSQLAHYVGYCILFMPSVVFVLVAIVNPLGNMHKRSKQSTHKEELIAETT